MFARLTRKIGSIKQKAHFCKLEEFLSSVKQTISFSNSIVEIKQKSAASARRKSTYFFANTEAKQVQNNIKYLMTSRFKMGIACWRVGFDSLMVATRLSRKSEKRPLTGDGEEPSAAHTTRTDHGQENEYSTTAYAQIQISILTTFLTLSCGDKIDNTRCSHTYFASQRLLRSFYVDKARKTAYRQELGKLSKDHVSDR